MDSVQISKLTNTAASEAISPKVSSLIHSDYSSSKTSDKVDDDAKSGKSSVKTKDDKKNDERYDYLVDKSEDGDTLQISPKGNEDLNDGFVIKVKITQNTDSEPENTDNIDRSSALTNYEKSLTNYNGISDAQLKQMYLKGIISQDDYQKEMNFRKARIEAERAASVSTSKEIKTIVANSADINETANAIKNAYGGSAKDAEISTQFIEAMDSVGENAAANPQSNINISIT